MKTRMMPQAEIEFRSAFFSAVKVVVSGMLHSYIEKKIHICLQTNRKRVQLNQKQRKPIFLIITISTKILSNTYASFCSEGNEISDNCKKNVNTTYDLPNCNTKRQKKSVEGTQVLYQIPTFFLCMQAFLCLVHTCVYIL